MRKAIRAAAPKAEQGMSYGMPAFIQGKPIAGYAASASHCAYYPMSGSVVAALKGDLEGYETSKGAIRFPIGKPLPATLIRKLVKARLAEIAAVAPKKSTATKKTAKKPMTSEDDVRRIAMSLPGAYEQPSYEGRPSWRTKPRMFTWIRSDPDALVVWVDSLDAKEALIACEPNVFFTTPHYDGHAIVLVRLDAVDVERARQLITESWKLRAPASLTRATTNKPRTGGGRAKMSTRGKARR